MEIFYVAFLGTSSIITGLQSTVKIFRSRKCESISMIWNIANTAAIGCRINVYDSRGTIIPKLMSVNTETGEAVRHKCDADGRPVVDRENNCIVREEILLSLPLKVTCKECEEELHIEADNDCSYCARRNRLLKINI